MKWHNHLNTFIVFSFCIIIIVMCITAIAFTNNNKTSSVDQSSHVWGNITKFLFITFLPIHLNLKKSTLFDSFQLFHKICIIQFSWFLLKILVVGFGGFSGLIKTSAGTCLIHLEDPPKLTFRSEPRKQF